MKRSSGHKTRKTHRNPSAPGTSSTSSTPPTPVHPAEQKRLDEIAELVGRNYLLDDFDGILDVLRRHRVSAQVSLFHHGEMVESLSFSTDGLYPADAETYLGEGIYGLVVRVVGSTGRPYRTWWRFEPAFFVQTHCARRLMAAGHAAAGGR